MADIFQMTYSKSFSSMKIVFIFIKILSKVVALGLFDNIPALVQIMDWHRSGDKPLSEPMMAYVTDTYMRH